MIRPRDTMALDPAIVGGSADASSVLYEAAADQPSPALYVGPTSSDRGPGAEHSAHNVAAYILGKCGPMTAMKLQKLLYYSQAWALVWDEKPLFDEQIEAWANGPVVPALYARHRGQFMLTGWPAGDGSVLTAEERETVDAVCSYYGTKSSQWLSDLTHAEAPWRDAREGLQPGERGNRVITHAAMVEYYSSLLPQDGDR